MRSAFLLGCAIFPVGMVRAVPSVDHEWHEDLNGKWRVEVTTYSGKSGRQNTSLISPLTLPAGGTSREPPHPPGSNSGSSEMGYWRRRGAAHFVSVTDAFIEFSTRATDRCGRRLATFNESSRRSM